jgi:acyl-homoserine-lactone acylase
VTYSHRSSVAALVGELLALDPKGDPEIVAAQAILARNGTTRRSVTSRGAALAILTAQPVITARDSHDPKAPTARARPCSTRSSGSGPTSAASIPEWGQVNRIRRGKVDLPIDGGPDTLRAVYGKPGDDGRLTALAGDTFIMLVSLGPRRRPLQPEHPPVRHGDPGRLEGGTTADQAPLFVAHALQAGAVHRSAAGRQRGRDLPARVSARAARNEALLASGVADALAGAHRPRRKGPGL